MDNKDNKLEIFKNRYKNNERIKIMENDRFVLANKFTCDGYNTVGIFSKKTKKEYISNEFLPIIENGEEKTFYFTKNGDFQEVI